MKAFLILIIFYFAESGLMAQSDIADSANISKTEFIAGATYNSALNYYGRIDSLKSKAFYPFVGINFKNGLYINSSFIFINNKLSTTYAATIAEGGYQFKNKSENWTCNLYANAFFYQVNNSLIQSALKGTAGINVTNLNKIINVNFGGDVKWSTDLDYGISAGLDHTFRIENMGKGIIVIDPSSYVYAGTQKFTKTFYEKKNILFFPAGEQLITSNSKKFDILSYEFSVPVVYGLGKMNIIVSPAYVLPENLITVDESGVNSANASNLFYVTATLKFTF